MKPKFKVGDILIKPDTNIVMKVVEINLSEKYGPYLIEMINYDYPTEYWTQESLDCRGIRHVTPLEKLL